MFKKILFAFDGSNASTKAVKYAIHLALLENSDLIFIHVIENIKQGGVIGLRAKYGDMKLVNAYTKTRIKNAQEWIKPIEKSAKDKGIKTRVEILEDDSNSLIGFLITFAEKNKVDLIVIGTRGISKFKRLLMGSVASGIVHHSKCPVLLIK
ncbi:MAG TPA: universal stress protein [Nitrososphaeraceae archaeon]|jgi:nucleotide-binding universal stress UspA family protein|nr:universal stress protein [Nitrososphaeraceae archaeon]